MNRFGFLAASLSIRPGRSLIHGVTALLIFSFVIMPFVHYHPAVHHFEKGGNHLLRGKIDFLSFSDTSVTRGEQGIFEESAQAPEVQHPCDTIKNIKHDIFFLTAALPVLLPVETAKTFPDEKPFEKITPSNHYHFHSTLSPPPSLA